MRPAKPKVVLEAAPLYGTTDGVDEAEAHEPVE
jgi:hypothetical protein